MLDADGLCACEFDPRYADDNDGEPSYHFHRICQHCGCEWAGLHCPHDGAQNPCPDCGIRPTPIPDAEEEQKGKVTCTKH